MGDDSTAAPPATEADAGRGWFDEDWAATILGLVILALVLVGAIPEGLVP